MNIANKQFHIDIQMNIHTETDESRMIYTMIELDLTQEN